MRRRIERLSWVILVRLRRCCWWRAGSFKMIFGLILLATLFVTSLAQSMTVHEPMKEEIYFYPRPGDEAANHVYVKPTDLITRNRLQLITGWPVMESANEPKPIDLVATAEVISQPIYFRKRANLANGKLKQKQNILYLDLPMLSPYPNTSENKVLE